MTGIHIMRSQIEILTLAVTIVGAGQGMPLILSETS